MSEAGPLYELVGVSKEFAGPREQVRILSDIDLRIEGGESLAVVGASGSGKTTLLQLMGGLDSPSGGAVLFQGVDMGGLSWEEKSTLRNRKIGFVFQFHHLLPEFSTLENVAMPGLISGAKKGWILERASETLDLVGLKGQERQRVSTLSGGERQLAAIARAIVLRPAVILADEPTGNLDARNEAMVAELLVRFNRELGTTLVLVTHNLDLAARMQRRLRLYAGEIYD
jgi:lipoprotein-releasing system ATP-binding protein